MRYRRLSFGLSSLGLTLMAVCGWWAEATAQGVRTSGYVYGNSATITVAVLPLQAEVRLDGVLLGSAHDLIARAVPVVPGEHIVQVSAAGYLPSVVSVPGYSNWASHINLELVPDRGP